MIRVYDFVCPAGHVTELFTDNDNHAVQCPHCDAMALRQIPAPRSQLDPVSGHFPSAAMSWEARRESHMKKERQQIESHGSVDSSPIPIHKQ